MNHSEFVDAVAGDPAVVHAMTAVKADGSMAVPSGATLKARAGIACQFAVAEMMNWTWVRYQIAVRTKTLTLTAAAHDLESDELEILAVTIGTDKQPVDIFFDPKSFVGWYYRVTASAGPADDNIDQPLACHIFARNATNRKRQITFEPGIGSNTTATIWYMPPASAPFSITGFPDSLHGYAYLVAVNYATGFNYEAAVQRIKGMVEERITQAHGTLDVPGIDPTVEERQLSRNELYESV